MKKFFLESRRGFTLIELLIVVAIIAILAAIAVPNFLEAQVRAKVSRAHADMRTLATAIDSYIIDNRTYPFLYNFMNPSPLKRLLPLTTPICYISTLPYDPFLERNSETYFDDFFPEEPNNLFIYNTAKASYGMGESSTSEDLQRRWSLTCAGPDRNRQWPYYAFPDKEILNPVDGSMGGYLKYVYDVTNGTVSTGDIFRQGGNGYKSASGINN